MKRQELEPKARELRQSGWGYKEIAVELKMSERQVRRWFEDERKQINVPSDWPEDRIWPGWTVDDLAGIGLNDFKREAWEGNLAMIRMTEASGNHHIGWVFRNLVEIGQGPNAPAGHVNWSLALAGLPVLADWLNCPACTALAALIKAHRPWEGGIVARQRQRAIYQREARLPAAAVKQCLMSAQAQMVVADISQLRLAPGAVLLTALAEHIPLFDRVPRGSPYRKFNLGGIILGILALPKGKQL